MKFNKVTFIIILFSLMLIGIVAIQSWWIKRSLLLNEQSFDSAVYRTLEEVVRQTEQKENYVFINNQLQTDTLLTKTKKLLKDSPRIRRHAQILTSSNVQVSVTGEPGQKSKTIIRVEKNENGTHTVQNSIITGDEINMSTIPTVPPVPPVPPVTIISREDKKEKVEVILNKMLNLRDPDSVSINPHEIAKIIAVQLRQNELPATFDFALLKKDSVLTFKTANFKDTAGTYKINLYPNDLFGRSVLLSLTLPGKAAHIRSDVWWVFVLSLFFTLTILVLFIYSIRMLLRHKKMLEMKNDFINHMSHEFKTPLTGISLGADMLMEKQQQLDKEQVHKIAATIKKQSQRLSTEVNDVLQNALLEETLHQPHVLFNMVDTVQNQVELFQPQMELLGAKIKIVFSSDKILMRGDEIQWQKVISNLIDNSLKFSRANPQVIISIDATGNKIRMEVADNGIGISSKDLPHIFDKFFRSDYYKQSNIQGFGLGLSFVKNIVTAHGGTIKAESELNAGTRIIIELNAEN